MSAHDDDMITPREVEASDELVPTWTPEGHVDEGTIQAWLDGAFGDAQAATVTVHVDGCGSCRAAVAEARGFIAGASRVVHALDAVPSGVVPRVDIERAASRIVAAADATRTRATREAARPRRVWYWQPAMRAAAAMLVMVAGGTYVWSRSSALQTDGRLVRAPAGERADSSASAPSKSAPSKSEPSISEPAASRTAEAKVRAEARLKAPAAAATKSESPVHAASTAAAPVAFPPSVSAEVANADSGMMRRNVAGGVARSVTARESNQALAAATVPVTSAPIARDAAARASGCWVIRPYSDDTATAEYAPLPQAILVGDLSARAPLSADWIGWPLAGQTTMVEFRRDSRGALTATAAAAGVRLTLLLTPRALNWEGIATRVRDGATTEQRVRMLLVADTVCKP